jgi:hypothetical protein
MENFEKTRIQGTEILIINTYMRNICMRRRGWGGGATHPPIGGSKTIFLIR